MWSLEAHLCQHCILHTLKDSKGAPLGAYQKCTNLMDALGGGRPWCGLMEGHAPKFVLRLDGVDLSDTMEYIWASACSRALNHEGLSGR